MLLKIAWRNIWRNKIRSLVVIIALALGLWAGTFTSGFYQGMMKQKIDDVIRSEMSHVQVHDTNFRDELLSKHFILGASTMQKKIEENPHVIASSARVISTAMMASANKSGGVKLVGINPTMEASTTELDKKVVEGEFFGNDKRNQILISKKMAELYGLKLRSKVVLTIQDMQNEIVAVSYRVVGIYKTNNGMLDEVNAYVQAPDLQQQLGLAAGDYHEIALLLDKHELAEPFAQELQNQYPDLEVKPWLDLATGMRYMVEASGTFAYVIVAIILVALLFSVVLSLSQSVLFAIVGKD